MAREDCELDADPSPMTSTETNGLAPAPRTSYRKSQARSLPGHSLLLLYPLRAWRDAPFFPTPALALQGLDQVIALAPAARLLDAGCGIGHGLAALRRVWPQAQVNGVEWSRPLAWLAACRCPWARVARGDMWATSWRGVDLVYLFQRPESMARAWVKARAEMAPGAWLVSLEFSVPGVTPVARLGDATRRAVWIYRTPTPASINSDTRR